jgi:hypothetical protein
MDFYCKIKGTFQQDGDCFKCKKECIHNTNPSVINNNDLLYAVLKKEDNSLTKN